MALPFGRLMLERPGGDGIMLKTALCEVLGIEVPIVLAAMGGTASSGEFAAAVSNQGGLGSIGSLFRATAAVTRDIDVARELTNRNFAVNHIPPTLDADAFRYTIGPAGVAGSAFDREVLDFDDHFMILRFVDPEISNRYGIMVFARCAS